MPKRRAFLKNSAAGIAAGKLDFIPNEAQSAEAPIDARKPFKRTSRYRSELVTIGMVGSRHGAHTQNIWGQKWNPVGDNIRTTGMNCRYVWCLREEEREFYHDKYGFEPVKNPEDMGGSIPGKKVNRSLVDTLGFLMGANVCFEQWIFVYHNLLMSLR